MTIDCTGAITGTAKAHTRQSLEDGWNQGLLVLPPAAGEDVYTGTPAAAPLRKAAFPAMLFMHGSSGITEQIRIFADWLARSLGLAVVVPDSMQLPERMTYTSPIAREDYEIIHALRRAELENAVEQLARQPWFNGQAILAGTSEGGVCVARFNGRNLPLREAGRILFSWSCEDNYHVRHHETDIPDSLPVLNVMSASDKFFSQANSFLDNPEALGHAARTLAGNSEAAIVLIPGAPHTLLNLPQTRGAVKAFIERALVKK